MSGDDPGRGRLRDRALLRGAVATIGARGILALSAVATLAIASRALDPAEFGVVSTLAALSVIVALANLGLSGTFMTDLATLRAVDDVAGMRRLSGDAVTAVGGLSVLIGVGGAASAFVLPWQRWLGASRLTAAEVHWSVAIFFLFTGASLLAVLGSAVLVAMQRLATDQIWAGLGGIAAVVLAGAAAAAHAGPVGFVAALSGGPALTALGRALWLLVEYPEVRPTGIGRLDERTRSMLRSSGFLGLINVSAAVSIATDSLVVAAVLGAAAAAVFNVAARMFSLFSAMVGQVGKQVWSALTDAIGRGDLAWARSRYWRALGVVGASAVLCAAVLVGVGRWLARIWVGPLLVPSAGLLVAFAIYTVYAVVVSQASILLFATQRLRALALATLLQTPLNLALSIVFTHRFGLIGPLLGTLVAHVPTVAPVVVGGTRRLLTVGLDMGPDETRSRSRRSVLAALAVTAAAAVLLAAITAAIYLGGTALIAIGGLVAVAAVAVIARIDLDRAGLLAVLGYVACCSWTGWYVAGQRPRGVLLLLAIVALAAGGVRRRLPSIPWWYLGMVGAVVLVAALDTLFPTSGQYLAHRYISAGATFGTGLTTGLSDLGTAERFLLTLVGGALAVCWCAQRFRSAPLWIATAYCIGAAVSGWVAYFDYLGVTSLGHSLTGVGVVGGRATGFTSHPNLLAGACALAAPIAAWFIARDSVRARVTGAVSLLGLVLGAYASGSRGGAICLLVGAALTLLLVARYRRQLAFILAGVGLVLGFLLVFSPSAGNALLRGVRLAGNSGSSDTGRIQVLEQGLRDFTHNPVFGVGLHVIDEAHNVLVQSLASGGLLLFGAFLCLEAGSAYAAGRLLRGFALAAPLLVTVVVGFVFGNLENTLTEPMVYVPTTLVVALVMQQRYRAVAEAPAGQPAEIDLRLPPPARTIPANA